MYALTKQKKYWPSVDARALVRLQCDQVNRSLVPAFYRYLQAQDEEQVIRGGQEFLDAVLGLVKLLERTESETQDETARGLWHGNGKLNLTDAMAGPCKRHTYVRIN